MFVQGYNLFPGVKNPNVQGSIIEKIISSTPLYNLFLEEPNLVIEFKINLILGICAHSITIAFHVGILEHYLIKWTPRNENVLQEIQPNNAGKKKNQNSRKRKKTSERSTEGYEDKRPAKPIIENNGNLQLVYINQTRSTTCQGCHKKYRATERSEVLPAPFDMVLGIKIHRLHLDKGSTHWRLSRNNENCYFHLRKKCIQ